MAVTTTNLGVITAYGDAVAAGYTGTKAEWQTLMASYATVGQQAVDAKNDAVAAKDIAVSKATEATTAANTATTKANEASASAQSIAQSASQIATNTSDISELKEDLTTKANIDGSYEDLVSGGAYQIISNMEEVDNTPYGYRTAGGSLEIGDREKLKKIVGGSLAVNQLVPDLGTLTSSGSKAFNNGTAKIAGHKYLFSANISADGNTVGLYSKADDVGTTEIILNYSAQSAIISAKKTATSDGTNNNSNGNMWLYPHIPNGSISNIMFIDLTAMFGSTIADYIYSLETATAGAGVEWLKSHFPRIFDSGYIPYNAGTLEHVSGLSAHKMTGFNQWDEEWELNGYSINDGQPVATSGIRSKNYSLCVPNTSYYVLGATYIFWYDINKNYLGYDNAGLRTSPNNARYFRLRKDGNTTYNHDICINLHWDGERDGEYEPYEEHSYPLDSDVTLRGIPKLDANNSLYYDGDEYVADGTVTRKFDIVTLDGSEAWTLDSSSSDASSNPTSRFYITKNDLVRPSGTMSTRDYNGHMISTIPTLKGGYVNQYSMTGIRIGVTGYQGNSSSNYLYIIVNNTVDATITTVEALKSWLVANPLNVVYELATPTTETADPYTEIQNVSNWGTEEFVTTSLVPVGHETAYQPDLRAKVEVAPESPDTDGYYLMKRENGENAYVAYLGELPSDPTTDGTYTLKCTVASGTATKTWEADT